MSMKLLFISTINAPWGGSEELWSQSAILLNKKNFKVAASVSYFGPRIHPNIQALKTHGVKVLYRKNKLRKYISKGIETATNHNSIRPLIHSSEHNLAPTAFKRRSDRAVWAACIEVSESRTTNSVLQSSSSDAAWIPIRYYAAFAARCSSRQPSAITQISPP